jgi:Cu(I)/Ag(I) efflux system membrane protein CusA/SilA
VIGMIARIIAFSIRHRFLVFSIWGLLALLGTYAVYQTPVDAIPDLSENQVVVFTEWAGHSPLEIEDQITYPLSLSLQGVGGVRVVRSSSDFGFSMINVIFDEGVGYHDARRVVGERLAETGERLPPGVKPKLAADAVATGQIFWYTVEGAGLDLGKLRSIQDWYVKPQLSGVAGVAEVASVGGYATEYQVEVDPLRLQADGLTVADVLDAVARSNSTISGDVIHKGNAEYIVRSEGGLGQTRQGGYDVDARQVCRDLEKVVLVTDKKKIVRLGEIARVTLGPQIRRGALEKDGNEATGGVILMRYGENPLEVTRRINDKIAEIQPGLPQGVRIVPFYDRTPLIEGAIHTVTGTLLEAMITATVCVLIVLLHLRTSLIITLTLPLATLTSFTLMWTLRRLGVVDVQTNIMSLAGIAISIGVLVDASIVMAENVMHSLKDEFGDRRVTGDVRATVLSACQAVGRPIFFSVMIMLLSFLPVFALSGVKGRMFQPLAFTKSFALLAVAVLAVTLVPALCTIFIRGRLRREEESWVVRSVIDVYRPVLSYLLDRPAPLIWFLGLTLLICLAPLGRPVVFLSVLALALVVVPLLLNRWPTRVLAIASLVVTALIAQDLMQPLGSEAMTALDEGMIMDMPITVPRASIVESVDDLKARDMVFCRFPEVDMVVGKAGRAETPSDPAPLDMIETMINFRPPEFWPRRKLVEADARRYAAAVLDALIARQAIEPPAEGNSRKALLDETVASALPVYDALMREFAYQRNQEFTRALDAQLRRTGGNPNALWRGHVESLNKDILPRAAATWTRLVLEEIITHCPVNDRALADAVRHAQRLRAEALGSTAHAHHHGAGHDMSMAAAPDPHPAMNRLQDELTGQMEKSLLLWQKDRADLVGFGGELDRVMQMPGWTNVWTMPIQNRVDMLTTGVNTAIGVRVLGRKLDDVVRASEQIAVALKKLPGAADVVADPVRGKGYLQIHIDRDRAGQHGLNVDDVNSIVETALGGKVVTTTIEGRERRPVRVRFPRAWRESEESIKNLMIPTPLRSAPVSLGEIANVGIALGPASIKSENGLLRNYVRLNVRDRDAGEFVEEARRLVASQITLPSGIQVEWTGQFEQEARARHTLIVIVPLVILLIGLILYWTYHDLADALLMLLAVPGSIAGGVLFQWLFGFKFSVTVWIGYIACFGMATSTGIIMLVYLREAVEKAGGLKNLTLAQLHEAVLNGAVHRLRPKILTEGTVVLGLAPMLWATGVGADVIRPMAAPVLGGILIADEVIDLLLPVLFYWVRRRRWQALQP